MLQFLGDFSFKSANQDSNKQHNSQHIVIQPFCSRHNQQPVLAPLPQIFVRLPQQLYCENKESIQQNAEW